MKGWMAVFDREVRSHGRLLVAAAGTVLLAYAIPLVRGIPSTDAQEVRAWIASACVVLLGAGAALGLGATMLSGAMASGRIRFDLSRPLSIFQIWFGRAAAGIALCALVVAIALLPIWIGGAGIALEEVLSAGWPVFLPLSLALVFLISQAVGIAVRSRSPLILLDGAIATLAALGVVAAIHRLNDLGANGPRLLVLAASAGLLFVAFPAATFVATARGRSDVRAAHRAQSAVLWPVLALVASAALGITGWVSRATPVDFTAIYRVAPALRGAWIRVDGRARGGDATFLYDTASRRFVRMRAASFQFSDAGALAVWLESDGRNPMADLRWCRLGGGNVVETPLQFSRHDAIVAVSEDGGRVAVQSGNLVAVYALREARLLASTPVGDVRFGMFEKSGALRLYARSGDRRVQILRFDPANRRLDALGTIETDERWEAFHIDDSRSRLLVREMVRGTILLFDALSGLRIRRLADESDYFSSGMFLSDGRIVLRVGSRTDPRFRLFSKDGELLREIEAEPSQAPALGGEIRPGQIVLSFLWQPEGKPRSAILDVDAGTIRVFARDLSPVIGDPLWSWGWRSDPASPPAGGVATRLFFQDTFPRTRLFLVDSPSGAPTPVLGPTPK